MRKFWFPGLLLGLFVSACSNEFDVAAPYQDIPVVYGVVSPDDTAHYIRVERAFIDPKASAYEVSLIADSIYYPANAISVFLERVSTGQRYQFTRVDGNLEGHVRESGTFAQAPNWLYKLKPSQPGGIIKGGEKYKLVIERADGRAPVTAETEVPDTLFLNSPKTEDIPRQIAIHGPNPSAIDFRVSKEAYIFDVYINIRYRELAPDGTLLGNKNVRWQIGKNILRENNLIGGGYYRGKAFYQARDFYTFLLGNVDTVANVQRYFNGFDIEVEGAGPEIAKYQESEAINAGLTGAEISTRYTNLSEGYGIFTAKRAWRFEEFDLKPVSFDSLNANARRRILLKFKG